MKVLDDLLGVLPPPARPVDNPEPLSWGPVTSSLGERLPSDYMRFVELYGSGEIDGYLTVFNPFSTPPYPDFFSEVIMNLSSLRAVRAEDPDAVPYPLYFEPGGLLPWGSSIDGDIFCWLTDHAISDRWRTVALLRNGSVFEYDTGVVGFLAGAIRGTLEPRCFTSPLRGTFTPLERKAG